MTEISSFAASYLGELPEKSRYFLEFPGTKLWEFRKAPTD